MTDRTTQQWTLAQRPEGEPTPDDFRWTEKMLPDLTDGQVLARTLYLSLDPYMRRPHERWAVLCAARADRRRHGGRIGCRGRRVKI